jgi:exodeoxyribonuclease-3
MKIVTYNLNGVRARLPRLVEYLEEQKPDLVCLQEIKCADESFPIEDVRAAGYDGHWHGQKGFNGVALLAPQGRTIELRRIGLPGDPDDTHSRYIEGALDGIVVGSIYLPNGNPVGTEKFAY